MEISELLEREDCNVISVDWYAGSSFIGYKWAVANVPLVGAGVASLLVKLHLFKGLDYGVVHFIGHSLGAHVSGFSAKHLHGKIMRITGIESLFISFFYFVLYFDHDNIDIIYLLKLGTLF